MVKKKKKITPAKKPVKPAPKKKKVKLGRPKKRGRKKLRYKKKSSSTKSTRKRKQNNTNKQYWKVYSRLKGHFDQKNYPYTYNELRGYAKLLYAEFKQSDELSGKRHKVQDKTLEAFFKDEGKIHNFLIKIGIVSPDIEPYPFWELEAKLIDFPNGTYVEISTDDVLGENGGETFADKVENIDARHIVTTINVFAKTHIAEYPLKYFWFVTTKIKEGYYIELVYDEDLDAGFKGTKYIKPEAPEERIKEEKPAEEIPEEKEEKAPPISDEQKRKQKAEADKAVEEVRESKAKADTAEIEKINTAIKGLYEELKMQKELDLADMMKDTLTEIKRLSEKRKKLTE